MLDKKVLALRAAEWSWAAFVAAWFLLPLFSAEFPAPPLIGPALVRSGAGAAGITAAVAAALAFAISLWRVAAFLLRKKLPVFADPDRSFSMALAVVSSAAVILVHAMHAATFADRAAYFDGLPWWVGLSVAAAVAWNLFSLIRVIRSLSENDAGYREYVDFKRRADTGKRSFKRFLRETGIQRRLTLVFSGLILFIIVVLAAVLLGDFGSTILDAVTENGQALADRAASVVSSNAADRIAIADFFEAEARKLGESSFPFRSMSYYRMPARGGALTVSVSTDPALVGASLGEGVPGPEENVRVDDRAAGTIEFRSPVRLSGVNIGFTSVVYDRDVIYGPYYRSRVKTLMIAAMFLYASVFFTYLMGRGIVFPILYLQMGVNSLATRLAGMVKGGERISADLLAYNDRVDTRDEIKKLSVEIGNMATVIRGVVPYISASTLQHAGGDAPSSERRELAFLFTDIRGFTTLCEGRSPEDVVTLLNRYLEIQTKAIIDNGGDVDKFVGDEIMAMFDGPDKETNACRASLAIRKAMALEQEKARSESSALISIGIGINSGPVVFGSVGARDRRDFTSIGDTVNLAARLEGANKTYGTKSLVTDSVYEQVKDRFVCREIDLLTVKGKTKPARIYEVLQEADKASPKLLAIKAEFEKGLAAYRAQKWDRAEAAFTACASKYGDSAAAAFLKRVKLFRASPPPADWDGVFTMVVK